jgi:hypothetical protein
LTEIPSLTMLGGALLGAVGIELIQFRIPAGAYLALAGVIWVLLWTAFLASVALHRRDRR